MASRHRRGAGVSVTTTVAVVAVTEAAMPRNRAATLACSVGANLSPSKKNPRSDGPTESAIPTSLRDHHHAAVRSVVPGVPAPPAAATPSRTSSPIRPRGAVGRPGARPLLQRRAHLHHADLGGLRVPGELRSVPMYEEESSKNDLSTKWPKNGIFSLRKNLYPHPTSTSCGGAR